MRQTHWTHVAEKQSYILFAFINGTNAPAGVSCVPVIYGRWQRCQRSIWTSNGCGTEPWFRLTERGSITPRAQIQSTMRSRLHCSPPQLTYSTNLSHCPKRRQLKWPRQGCHLNRPVLELISSKNVIIFLITIHAPANIVLIPKFEALIAFNRNSGDTAIDWTSPCPSHSWTLHSELYLQESECLCVSGVSL